MLLWVCAAMSGAVAVMAGAYGAHGATGAAAEWLKTGAQYQLVHAVAVFAIAGRRGGTTAGWLFVVGAALFAGSLYGFALGAPRWIGPITPLGGLALVAGWLWLAWRAVTTRSSKAPLP